MLKNLFIVFVAVLCSNLINAQNVFNPGDAIVTYNSAALAGSATNPNQPAAGVMAPWVRTSRMSWSTTNFKCYIWNGMAFRMRFPNNYNPANATKYPVVVFYHGGGEIGTIYDNEDQLTWGAQLFEQRINSGEWNGFLIFPQETSIGWDDTYFSRVNGVLDTLQKYNNSDPDRLIAMGLSSGGYGSIAYASAYPQRVASVVSSSPEQARTLSSTIPGFVHVPLWIANGGLDVNPDPYNAQGLYQDFRNAGGNIYQTYYVNDSHDTWENMWAQKNASGGYITSTYWNTAHKAQPLVYYQNQQFCGSISARMGISAGYYAYQWAQNGSTIPSASSNEYTATQAGSYSVRFMRTATSDWSAWTPNPVVISSKTCAADTLFAEHFTNDNIYVSASEYSIGNFTCEGGIMTSGTDALTQDATGVQGNRYLINYTTAGTGCTFTAGDRVWNTYTPVTVLPNTNYEYSFYVANQTATSPAQLAPTINGTALIAGSVSATGSGNSSWKKFTYTWNSGAFTYADLALINRNAATTGNDFAIDEISFKLAPAVPVPGCTANTAPANAATLTTNTTATLTWTAATNAASYDVYLWTGATLPTVPVATVTTTTYSATALIGSTLYNWYVVPKNSAGVAASGCGNNQTSFTTAVTPVAPACVTNSAPVSGSTLTTTSTATLTWAAAATATSYDVYIWTGATIPTTPKATVTTTSYNVTGLIASTLYNWYIVPKNAVGSSTGCNANASTFTTAAGPVVPTCATNASPASGATLSTATTVTLTWNAATAATSYDIYLWKGNTAPTTSTANVTATSYNASALTASTLYHWYVVPKNAAGAATGCSSNATTFTTALAPIAGKGTGLRGDYYNTIGLTGSIYLSRTDATVNFNWGTSSPYRTISATTYSVRWTGFVQPLYSETYTFYTTSDDGIRIWVNGVEIINNWTIHSATENSGTITLTAGVKYSIKIEYYNNTGSAVASLSWSSASTPKAIVPQKQLYLPGNGNRTADVDVSETSFAVDNSRIIGVAQQKTGVYPNPVIKGQLATLQLNSERGGTATVQIAGLAGNIIQTYQLSVAAGGNTRTISTAGLAPGIYFVHIAGSVDTATTLKLVVQ